MLELDGKFYFVTVESVLDELGLVVQNVVGSNLMLCCPIHGERHPSFGIHADTGVYHCFSCGARGNILNLIQVIKGKDLDARKFLISLHTSYRAIPKLEELTVSRVVKAPERDLKGLERAYLTSRGISIDVIEMFGIYATGTCVVFPINDIRGDLVGYQKRDTVKKRYIFSKGFDKNDQLFGLDVLREYGDASKPLFITESIIDCLTVWSYGGQAIAIFSAHMTKQQVKLLSQTPFRVILDGLDRDLAGRLGWERAERLLIAKGFRPITLGEHGKKDINELTESEFMDWSN